MQSACNQHAIRMQSSPSASFESKAPYLPIKRNHTQSDAITRNQTQSIRSDAIRRSVPALRQDAVVAIELVRVVLVPVARRDRRERRRTRKLEVGQVPMERTL